MTLHLASPGATAQPQARAMQCAHMHTPHQPPQLLAERLATTVSALLIDHADVAVAHMFWFASNELGEFIAFIDELVAPYDFLQVLQVGG